MRRYYYDPPGSPPGMIHAREQALPPRLQIMDYNAQRCVQKFLSDPQDIRGYLDTQSVSWIDVQGLGHAQTLTALGEIFQLHALTLEDIANVPQRPKVEEAPHQLLIVAQMITLLPEQTRSQRRRRSRLHMEQVSFILGRHYLLTVQEEPQFDTFESVRDRIIQGRGVIRDHQADYLAYCLIDTIIDGFFPVLEALSEDIESLELEVLRGPGPATLAQIHQIRRDLLTLRRSIWPQRDMLALLSRDGSPLLGSEVQVYLRDCYDHAAQVIDTIEIYRELTASLMDIYLSAVSNRMNEVMKTLTVISTIFIPLTFVAGIYGMNFNPEASPLNMPELNWYWGYPLAWLVMLAIASGMITFFWRRHWF
ncbi:magnesium/cobalt transporter CorA [Lyngbya confervoides]|uniref:Magnesium transport protein CorA n=1 Tax=Lyngbya confervoides BDU141951 TaxID=1574623 RepID=A0ABD4T2G4_9CYAN|nr:magnesium/cobalt transporter CorA [Lyngbya confervoides]MCM1982956.1 magnesium/cobalt transporter CorA [Lyngbya confervoides BDU141951]